MSAPSSSRVTSYGLDATNNRTSVTQEGVTTTYDLQTRDPSNTFNGAQTQDEKVNQYAMVNGIPYQYDNAGNLYTNGAAQMYWDYDGKLLEYKTSTADYRYGYDALGRRISKRSADGSTQITYWWDGWRCVQEANNLANVVN